MRILEVIRKSIIAIVVAAPLAAGITSVASSRSLDACVNGFDEFCETVNEVAPERDVWVSAEREPEWREHLMSGDIAAR